jgi:uncharacterized protein
MSDAPPIERTPFEIPAAEGPPVRGDLRVLRGHRADAAVVICHGFKGFRAWGFFPLLAKAIAAEGFAAVTFDFSRNGVGDDGVDFSALDRFAAQTHGRNVEEIRRVLDTLSSGALLGRAARRIGLLGHSRGGAEAVLAAAEDPRVDALATWAAVADIPARWTPEQVERWAAGETVEVENARTGQRMPVGPEGWREWRADPSRLDVLAAARRLSIPWLIVHGDADASVPVDDAHALFEAAGDAAELLVVEGGDHTFGARHPYAGATPELATVAEATLGWLGEHLE